jgi:hypothetical protein
LPGEVEVDLETLIDPAGVIRAGEIALPANVLLLTDAEDVVARIEALRVEEVAETEEEGGQEPEAGGAAEEAGEEAE